ncbi:MAG: hypothetical protein SCALA702_29750 [Melioribacteraceae bacterium]|nr:MAG: hypothetical protein SCALA702_29750 [Melioribacteraceae bacterium]
MKKYHLFVLIFLVISSISFAQAPQVGWISKFGAAAGVNPMWVMPNTDEVNKMLPALGLEEISDNGFFALGGSGYLYIMFVKNLRLGGYGFSGTTESSGVVGTVHRSAQYSVSGGGITVEYTMPFIRGVAVSAGAMLGMGSIELNLYNNAVQYNYGDQWVQLGPSQQNSAREMTNTFYTVSPMVNVDIPLTRFIAFRAGAGYQITFVDEWTVANGRDLNGVPDDLSSGMFFFQTGLYIGLFAF